MILTPGRSLLWKVHFMSWKAYEACHWFVVQHTQIHNVEATLFLFACLFTPDHPTLEVYLRSGM